MSDYDQCTYRVDLAGYHGLVVVTGGVITDAKPPFERFIGARIKRFKSWVERKGGTCEKV